ncbi:MAG TPA: T9SS type A sorting domain-containing protein [Flavipsychrobacter sp.]|nr:T9SS type A sorting domain-containing protein [Flavipsychrobacter sp.]
MTNNYFLKIYLSVISLCLWSLGSTAQNYNVTTTVQCNTTTGGVETVNFATATPNAIGDGTLTLYYNGDLSTSEYIDFFGESSATTQIGTATNGSSQCGANYDSMVLTIPMADINAWAADGTITIVADAASSVNNICTGGSSFCIYMKLDYPRASGLNDIGVASIDTPTVFCAGPQNIWVTVKNYGINQITTGTVNWTWNGVVQTQVSINQLIDTAQGMNPNSLQLMLGTKTITDADTIVVWTSNPNGGVDTTNVNDTVAMIVAPSLMGTYTLNAAVATGGGNYQTFGDFVNDISNNGICGPIVLNITPGSGPYIEQVDIPQISGSSATNTITINGNGDTLTSGGSASNYATLNLDGADFFIFKNLVIEASSTTSNFAVHLMNDANNNTFDSCVIVASISATSSTANAVSMSGSKTSYSTAGNNGSNNTFSNSTISGGYFGLVFYGSSASANVNNSIINCHISDFYLYGCYYLQQSGATVSNNIIERPNRTTVTTFYGVMLSTGCNNMLVEKNMIRNAGGTSGTGSFTAYCIYNSAAASLGNENKIYNNIIYNIGNTGTIAGLYMPSGTYVQAYHNTIVLNNTAAASGTVYGIYSTGTAGVDVKNNNIYITQGGSGVKYGLYFSGAGKSSDHNNIFVNSSGGSNNTGYFSTAYPTLASWQTANSGAWDQNSVEVNPFFTNITTGNFTPGNSLMDDIGTPVGINADINGAPRSLTTPDIGAIEFSVPPCFGTPIPGTASAANNATNACLNGPIDLSLTGFSLGGGISIQWEESPAGAGVWSPIAGATTGIFTDTLTGPTDYRAVVTCSNGGGFDVSNTVNINVSPFYLCYCSPLNGVQLQTSAGTNYMTNVSIPNTTLNSTTTAVGAGGYLRLDHTISTNTATIAQSVPYTLEVTTSSTSANSEAWIDWDMSGTFDSAEYITLTTGGTLKTGTILIPPTSMTGVTGMRIRNVFSATTFHGPTGACTSISLARETEDYVITIAPAPSCLPPATATPTSVTASTAVVEWETSSSNPANGYEWRVFAFGNGPTGTPLFTGTEPAGDTVANVSGLSAISNYTFFVRALCSGSNSLWTSVNFTTPCAAYAAPWYDSVESQTANTNSVMTNCWTSNPTNQTGVLAWHVTGTGTTSSSSTGPSFANSGMKYFFLETSSGSTNQFAELFTPQVNISTLTTPMLEFYYHMYGATTNKLVISAHNGTTWNDVDSIIGQQQTSETDPWIKRSVYLTGYTGVTQVKFTAYRGTSFTGDISIDDISIVQAPSCPAPTNPSAVTTMTTAALNWTENGSATLWQIEYGPANFTPGTGTLMYVSSKPHPLTSLTHSTEYSYFVRAVCGSNDTSVWSPREVFATIPINDTCANAINIGGGQSTPGTTAGATQSMPAGTCAATTTYANDVWYHFSVGNTPGSVTITATNTVGDVVLEVLSGTCGSMTELSCVDVPAIGTETITLSNLAAGIYYVRVYGFTSIENAFTVQVTGTPLAIKLVDITAENTGARNRIDWKTAEEMKRDQFIVERSEDGKVFSKIGMVKANGIASTYTYWDEKPVDGRNFYRLKMTEANGNFTYSEIVTATASNPTHFAIDVFPNPTANKVTVAVRGEMGTDATLFLTDLTGKIIRQYANVNAQTEIDLSDFASGIYLIKYSDAKHTETIRVNKK